MAKFESNWSISLTNFANKEESKLVESLKSCQKKGSEDYIEYLLYNVRGKKMVLGHRLKEIQRLALEESKNTELTFDLIDKIYNLRIFVPFDISIEFMPIYWTLVWVRSESKGDEKNIIPIERIVKAKLDIIAWAKSRRMEKRMEEERLMERKKLATDYCEKISFGSGPTQ